MNLRTHIYCCLACVVAFSVGLSAGEPPTTRPGTLPASVDPKTPLLNALVGGLVHSSDRVRRNDAGDVVMLDLSFLPLSAAAIEEIPKLEELQDLAIWKPTPRSLDLRPLAKLRHLGTLGLLDHEMSASYLAWLRPDSSIHAIGLEGCTGVGKNLKYILAMRLVPSLGLEATDVSDADLEVFRGEERTVRLRLWDTSVTDAALPIFMSMKDLQLLDLGENQKFSDESILKLRRHFPEISVPAAGR